MDVVVLMAVKICLSSLFYQTIQAIAIRIATNEARRKCESLLEAFPFPSTGSFVTHNPLTGSIQLQCCYISNYWSLAGYTVLPAPCVIYITIIHSAYYWITMYVIVKTFLHNKRLLLLVVKRHRKCKHIYSNDSIARIAGLKCSHFVMVDQDISFRKLTC